MASSRASAAAGLLLAALCIAAVQAELTPSTSYVLGLFDKWNAALATLDPEKVADLYAPTAVLLPTVSNKARQTREEIVDYFVSFLKNKPQGNIDSYKVRRMDDKVVGLYGIYTFTFAGGNTVQARFSFTYKKQADGKYLIVEHHSSAMPENYVSEILNAFSEWNSMLQTGDANKVADMYAPGAAVLLPTVSNEVRTSRDSIKRYFEVDFLPKGPYGTILTIPGQSPNIRLLAPGVAINSGVYKFELKKANATVFARYSMVYVKYGSAWKIADMHSSAMPEGALEGY